MTSRNKGICCLIFSAFSFAVMGLGVRVADLVDGPLPVYQKAFFRNFIAFLLVAGLFVAQFSRGASSRNRPSLLGTGKRHVALGLLLARSILGTIGILTNFYALSHLPLGDACFLNKLAPFFVLLFSWLFFSERPSAAQFVSLLGAIGGAVLVVKPGWGSASLSGLVGVVSGIAAGAAYACVRGMSLRGVDSKLIVGVFSIFSTMACLPLMYFTWRPMCGLHYAALALAGLGAAGGQFGITYAYHFAAAREIAVFDYTNILFATLLGFVFLNQIPDVASWVGYVIIVLMALLSMRKTAKAAF